MKSICAKCEESITVTETGCDCRVGKSCCNGSLSRGIVDFKTGTCQRGYWPVSIALNLNTFFDRVVVISLKRRPERLTSFLDGIKNNWPFKQPELFVAIDGNKVGVPSGVINKSGIKENQWKAGGGAWGCMQSHRQVLERAISDDVKSLLVLEDDAEPVEDFNNKVSDFLKKVPTDWDGLMLGGQHFSGEKTKDIRRCTNCQRTHAYAIRGKYLKDLYQMWHSFYWHCDHAMGPFQVNYKVYAPEPFLIGQRINKSDISGRLEPQRFWSGNDKRAKVAIINCTKSVIDALRVHGIHTGFSLDASTGIDNGLLRIVKAKESAINKKRKLQEWLSIVQGEASAFPMQLLGIWYPEMPPELKDLLIKCLGTNLLHINVPSVGSFLKQWEAHSKL